jgi:hypothetical protein
MPDSVFVGPAADTLFLLLVVGQGLVFMENNRYDRGPLYLWKRNVHIGGDGACMSCYQPCYYSLLYLFSLAASSQSLPFIISGNYTPMKPGMGNSKNTIGAI